MTTCLLFLSREECSLTFTCCCLGPSVDIILMLTGETSLLTSLVSIYIVCVIITSAAFFVVRVMPVEMYGKSWFACLQVRRL